MGYVAGYDKGVSFQKSGAGGATSLNVTRWDWAEQVQKLVTTHTGSSGIEAVLAGILSGEGNVEANLDVSAMPNATAPGITAGTKGTLNCNVGGATAIIIPVMVTKLNWRSSVDGLVSYSFAVTIDSTTGSYTRPT